ncbi:hypothetical protein Pelo_5688 [Pelomyxa schiedti]|nr:hypothetical protein Pelo_5688 [Pelomyxa schiedti]
MRHVLFTDLRPTSRDDEERFDPNGRHEDGRSLFQVAIDGSDMYLLKRILRHDKFDPALCYISVPRREMYDEEDLFHDFREWEYEAFLHDVAVAPETTTKMKAAQLEGTKIVPALWYAMDHSSAFAQLLITQHEKFDPNERCEDVCLLQRAVDKRLVSAQKGIVKNPRFDPNVDFSDGSPACEYLFSKFSSDDSGLHPALLSVIEHPAFQPHAKCKDNSTTLFELVMIKGGGASTRVGWAVIGAAFAQHPNLDLGLVIRDNGNSSVLVGEWLIKKAVAFDCPNHALAIMKNRTFNPLVLAPPDNVQLWLHLVGCHSELVFCALACHPLVDLSLVVDATGRGLLSVGSLMFASFRNVRLKCRILALVQGQLHLCAHILSSIASFLLKAALQELLT